jgi:hypothetical protein
LLFSFGSCLSTAKKKEDEEKALEAQRVAEQRAREEEAAKAAKGKGRLKRNKDEAEGKVVAAEEAPTEGEATLVVCCS